MRQLRFARLPIPALALAAALATQGTTAPAAKKDSGREIVAEANGITVRAQDKGTLQISVDGAMFSDESRMFVLSPNWKTRYYSYDDDKDLLSSASLEKLADGSQRITFVLSGQGSGFAGKQTVEVGPNRTLKLALDGVMPPPTSSTTEIKLLTIPPAWITGRTVTVAPETARGPGLPASGLAPLVAPSEEVKGATLATAFQELKLETPLGPVGLKVDSNLPFSLVDYRRNKWSLGKFYYWFGVLDNRLPSTGQVKYSMTFSFPPASKDDQRAAASIQGLTSHADALGIDQVPDRIIPTPKQITWLPDNLTLTSATSIVFSHPDSEGIFVSAPREVAQFCQQELGRLTGLKLAEPQLYAEEFPSPRIAFRLMKTLPGLGDVHADRYRISFDNLGPVIEGETTSALYAATRSLFQMLRPGNVLRKATIDDGATMPFRGIHFFTGRNAGALQERFLRNILGPLKLNTLVYQVDYLKWASYPEIHHPTRGMDLADAAKVRDEAKRQAIEIIPLLNTFGHSEWLLNNDRFRHLSDNPNNPYAYDPSNPETYEVCDKIYDEAIAFFQPRAIHIGHDEITDVGFPFRPANKAKGLRQLVLDDINHWHEYLSKRKLTMHLWSDMFLHATEANDAANATSPAEARLLRKALPKGTIVHDWHYAPDPVEKFISLSVFNKDGLDAVAATWYDARNVVQFAKAAAQRISSPVQSDDETKPGQTLGLLQTTWAGYSFDQGSLDENPDQYAAYLLAAEAAWNGGAENPRQIPYDYRAEFARLWNRGQLPDSAAPGWTVDLNSAANFEAVPAPGAKSWLGASPALALDGLKGGKVRLGRFLCDIPGGSDNPKAVLFASRFAKPGVGKLSLNVKKRTAALNFAVAATYPGTPGEVIARTTVVFGDGTTATLPWKLGTTVFPFEDDRSTFQAPVLWKREGKKEDPARVIHGFQWINPRPEVPIHSIVTESEDKASGLVLFAITGVDYIPDPAITAKAGSGADRPEH